MKEYFRNESIAFRYTPVFYLLRLAFVALILVSGNVQWCFMVMGSVFSMGFVFDTEEEYILPLTEDEMKKRRLVRVNMIWLRYLVLGLGAYALSFVLPPNEGFKEVLLNRPMMCLSFFVLQMICIYNTLLDLVIDNSLKKKWYKTPLASIALFMFFVYGMSYIFSRDHGLFNTGSEIVHVGIILGCALIILIYIIRTIRIWRIMDFKNLAAKLKAGKGGI